MKKKAKGKAIAELKNKRKAVQRQGDSPRDGADGRKRVDEYVVAR